MTKVVSYNEFKIQQVKKHCNQISRLMNGAKLNINELKKIEYYFSQMAANAQSIIYEIEDNQTYE